MTLPDLNRRLSAERLDALLAVPAIVDPDMVDGHFPSATQGCGRLLFPNGSTLRIRRGSDAAPRSLEGFALDVAVVLAPWPAATLDALRARLMLKGGKLFAPYAVEVTDAVAKGPTTPTTGGA